MSDPRLSTIGELLGGAPEHLVERSAAARAQAQGIPVEEVLSAWSGGGEIAAAAVIVAEAPPAPAVSPAEAPLAAPPADAPALAPVAEPPPEPAVAAVEMVEDELEPVEPAPLSDRIRLGAKTGAAWGAVLGLLAMAAGAPLLLNRVSQTTLAGGPAVEVTWTAAAAFGAVWAAAGAVITMASRGAGRFLSPSYDTDTTALGSVLSGGFIGMVLGAGLGGVLYAAGEASLSGTRLIAVGPGMVIGLLAASAVLGAVIGGVGQALAQPAALSGAEAEEAHTVKRRLSDALALPLASFAVIAVIVVSFGSLLLRYRGFAPWLAILVAGGIVAFAALMASRPNLKVTKGEVLVAAAGVGVVLLMLALIAASVTDGEGGEESEEAPDAEHALVYEAG